MVEVLRASGRRASFKVLLFAAPVVFVGFARDASAFCRTTTVLLPADYRPSSGCFTDGLPLFWRNACVGYSLNHAASRQVSFDVATSIVKSGFSTWLGYGCPASGEKAGIDVSNLGPVDCTEVRYNRSGGNQNVIVFRDDKWPYNDPNNTLGLTTITFNEVTGEIFDADIEINATGDNLSTSENVPPSGFDLLSIITHEAGHFYGLAHATRSTSTMFASYRPGSSSLRTLTADDVEGLCAIYPTSNERNVGPSVAASGTVAATACDTSPRHGFISACGSDGDDDSCAMSPAKTTRSNWPIGLGASVVGMVAFRRLRRRR